MLFNSLDFLIFFPVVVLVYFIIPNRWKHIWLLITSYYFYMCWNVKYVILIFASTLITYLSGLFIEKIKHLECDNHRKNWLKKSIVAVSFLSNLGILFYFKYINFAIDILVKSFAKIHVQLQIPAVDIILPVGISFYTFQALSYTMDVYRDDIYAEKDFCRYALFVSFFPQLVAGPIERSKNLLKQLSTPRELNVERFREGFLLMLWGYFLKLVLADRIALFVDTVYGDCNTYSGMYLVVATILFAVQIYCDFSGYSIIAMGVAKILGIQLMENFDAPYLAISVADFWRRWHISLTSWFKDYLYIPLGGNRRGKVRKFINIMIVFLVSGLWHGANFSFVVWGGLNGLYQIVGELLKPIRERIGKWLKFNKDSLGYRLACILGTFVLIDFSWIFFRADGFTHAINVIKSIINVQNPVVLFDDSLYQCGIDEKNFHLMLISIGILLFADICKLRKIVIRDVILKQDYWFRLLFIVFSVAFILVFGMWGPSYNQANFIYFQF